MRKRILSALGLALLVLVTYLAVRNSSFLSDPTKPRIDIMSKPTELRYGALEIREYEGVRLDPSIGPRDNSIRGVQSVDLESYALKVTGLVNRDMLYTYEDVLSKEHHDRLIKLYCVEGWDATVLWTGVRLVDLLDDAGLKEESNTVIFHCIDGYTTSIPLTSIRERDMLLAFFSNGTTLPESLGFPFIVVAQDKLGYKWARWVTGIEASDNLDYKGYWEKRGYSNDAEVKR